MTDELTRDEQENIINLFKNHGMCSDCIAELREFIPTAKKSDDSKVWAHLLCYDCQTIFIEMVTEVKKGKLSS